MEAWVPLGIGKGARRGTVTGVCVCVCAPACTHVKWGALASTVMILLVVNNKNK